MSVIEQDSYRETRVLDLEQLLEFPGNANVGNIPAIAASLRKNGQYRPLIVRLCDDGTMVVVAGNHTRKAFLHLGITKARCEIHVMDDQTALRDNVADNRLAALGVVDNDLLIEQLSYFDGDYEGTGYDQGFVDFLLDDHVGPRHEHESSAAGAKERTPPEQFPQYDDDIKTDYSCPKCGYDWSGKPK